MCPPVFYQFPYGVMVAHALVNDIIPDNFSDLNKLIAPATTEKRKSVFSVYEKETISEVSLFWQIVDWWTHQQKVVMKVFAVPHSFTWDEFDYIILWLPFEYKKKYLKNTELPDHFKIPPKRKALKSPNSKRENDVIKKVYLESSYFPPLYSPKKSHMGKC